MIFTMKEVSRRIQHEETNVTVIIGSHRNSQLKIELNGDTMATIQNIPGSSISSKLFQPFWIQLECPSDGGVLLTVGHGRPNPANISHRSNLQTTAFNRDIHIGLSTWDSHLCYRMIRVTAPLPLYPAQGSVNNRQDFDQLPLIIVPSLFQTVQNSLSAWLRESSVSPFSILPTTELLNPGAQSLYEECLVAIAGSLTTATAEDLSSLSFPSLSSILDLNSISINEMHLFDIALEWIQRRMVTLNGGSRTSYFRQSYPQRSKALTMADLSKAYLEASLLAGEQIEPNCSSSCPSCRSTTGETCYECLLRMESHKAIEMEAESVFSLIRYPLMTPDEVLKVLTTPFVVGNHRILSYIGRCLELDGQEDHQGKDQFNQRRRSLDVSYTKHRTRRLVSGAVELTFVSNGDANGVIRWIGSEGTQFLNPQLTKRVVVTASSPPSKQTDYKSITECRLLHCNVAGQRLVKDGSMECWWRLSLQGRKLLVNHYSLRSDGSTLSLIRDWDFQALSGLQGGEEVWVTLRSHRMDPSITRPGQFASWPIHGPFASVPYSSFRWILRGSKNVAFPLSCVELYGFLFV